MSDGEDLIHDIWRRWNQGERELDPEDMDPELEIYSAIVGQFYEGTDGVRRWTAEIDEQFESWELGIDEVRELAPERFIAHGSINARGRQSGVDLDQPASWLIELRAGRLRRVRNFIGPGARADAEAGARA